MFLPHAASTVAAASDGMGHGTARFGISGARRRRDGLGERIGGFSVAAAEVGADLHAGWGDWVRAAARRAPALVLGLAAMIALLPLAFAGRLVRGHEPADADQAEAVEPRSRPRKPRAS